MPEALSTTPSNVVALERDELHVARARIRRIFQFLDAYVQLRNPVVRRIAEQPWTLWLRDLPTSPSVSRPDTEKPDERFIFRVRRPTATPCPRPPHELEGWLLAGWDQPGTDLRLRDTLEIVEGGKTHALRFDDERSRTRGLEKWRAERATWEKSELPERAALELFERLYALHGQIEREAEKIELLVGDGILDWRIE